jgi:dTDP-4-dehydrorhamnose reductase
MIPKQGVSRATPYHGVRGATRLLVTGASGLLGLNLALHASCQGYAVTGVVHAHRLFSVPFNLYSADLTQPGEVTRLFDQVQPEVIVHCAAVANLEAAEAAPELALRLNTELPGQLAAEAKRSNTRFVHISTDAVFDGARGDYSEEDRPDPLSVYARSKLAGEQAVVSANPGALIARVNFYGWSLSGKRSLAEWFYNSLSARQPVKGFTDVYFCPLLANDLAELLLHMVGQELSGVYHVASREGLSKYAFGVGLARLFGLDESLISPVSVHESGLVAQRSPNLTLRTDNLARDLGVTLPGQAEGLRRFYELYQQDYPSRLRAFAGPG